MTNSSFTGPEFQAGFASENTRDVIDNPKLRGVTAAHGAGVIGVSYARKSKGWLGGSDAVFEQSAGVYGESEQQGVFGHGTTITGTGVFGISQGAKGFGVRGESADGVAVQGRSFGNGTAVQGIGGKLAGRFEGPVEIVGNLNLVGNMKVVTGDIQFADKIADLAEAFEVAAHDGALVEPGMVMVIDAEGTLTLCRTAYDRRAVGVVSGAGDYRPGIVLDGSAPNRPAIALVGKVFCKVDARESPIVEGDLLTTSATPGHAMRACDQARTPGAVIGKALRRLENGTGLIPILVALQ
jgi:hypothetical protein